MKIRKIFILVILFLTSSLSYAGGEYWPVKVEEKISTTEPHQIKLEILEDGIKILQECKHITVFVEYQRVTIWSWLPFFESSHPTKEETVKAVEYLNNKFNKSEKTYFGYIGGGLVKEPSAACTFKSKGLKLMKIDNENEFSVHSYYDPV